MKILLFGFVLLGILFSLQAEIIPFLGVTTADIVYSSYTKYEITDGFGVLIQKIVAESQAEEAGLQKDMIIRTFKGEKVYTRKQLVRMIRNSEIGETVEIGVLAEGKEQIYNIALGEREIRERHNPAWMGVTLQDKFELEGFTEKYGLLITSVSKESPALKAGLQENDVMLSLQDEKLYAQDQVRAMLKLYKPEDQVKVEYWQDGIKLSTILTLGELSLDMIDLRKIDNIFNNLDISDKLEDVYGIWNSLGLPEALHVFAFQDSSSKILGVIVSDISDEMLAEAGIPAGLKVDKVIPETPADAGGILAGDIILKINDRIVSEFEDIGKILKDVEYGANFEMNVLRDDKPQTLKITMTSVTDEVWDKYYSNMLENDVFKVFIDKDKPLDFYYENLEDLDDEINHEIELEYFKSDSGSM
ncbi:MAG: PDZ domain-containing protein [Candidatus Cloacimonetes bacterium]|nr:PDZ domain-containing protein [Candidatus Cloacimonadota bacterium]